jgi:predicted transcriptional regulator
MAVEKFSVSFDPELGRQIRALALAEDLTVSAFLAEAARERVRQALLQDWVDEIAAKLGKSSEELADIGKGILANEAIDTGVPRRRKAAA